MESRCLPFSCFDGLLGTSTSSSSRSTIPECTEFQDQSEEQEAAACDVAILQVASSASASAEPHPRYSPHHGGRSLLEALGEDAAESGGASIVMVYRFLNVWEIYFAAGPCAKSFHGAARCCFSSTGRPFCIVPEDIDRLRCFLRDTNRDKNSEHVEARIEGLECDYVGRLMQASPEPVRVLALQFGVNNARLRSWIRQGLLREVVELHLMGKGEPSDAGLANLVAHCSSLRYLTILCSSVTAAAALLLEAQVKGELGAAWWEGMRFSRLCILPRLQASLQKSLTVQRIPPWLCGEWAPLTPVWGFEVQHYDPLGRFIFLQNGGVERVGVVRSCVPSPFGPWWEVNLCFFARQSWFDQMLLIWPLSGPSSKIGRRKAMDADPFTWHAGSRVRSQVSDGAGAGERERDWVGTALGLADTNKSRSHLGTIRTAVMGSSEHVRHRPRQFPRQGRRVGDWMRRSCTDDIKSIYPWNDREWAEAALSSSAEGQDSTLIFDHAESSEEEGLENLAMPSMQELLAQLDRDEQPSRRAEEGSAIPSLEELMTQLDVEEQRDRE